MNIILFDDPQIRQSLLPLTFTRPVAALRIGILTIAEKWEKFLNFGFSNPKLKIQNPQSHKVSFLTENYLQKKFSLNLNDENILINGAVCPNERLFNKIQNLKHGQSLVKDTMTIAIKFKSNQISDIKSAIRDSKSYPPTPLPPLLEGNPKSEIYEEDVCIIKQLWDIFENNGEEIRNDFEIIKKASSAASKGSNKITDKFTILYNSNNIFVEEGAVVKAAILNAEDGPIYIGKNAQIHEGAIIKGPFALCEGAHVNMGGKMREDTTIGPYSKVGGEIINSVIIGYSNKAHDGFMGNTVIGEWCNLGADTNTSNLKNNYSNVKIWNYNKRSFIDTGRQFFGLIMGDHSKCGINTMFNTGTIVGVSTNIFGAGFPRNFIPSFSWGGTGGFSTYQLKKACEVAEIVMKRRGIVFDETERLILKEVFEMTKEFRYWDK